MIHSFRNSMSTFRLSNRRQVARAIAVSLTLLAAAGCSSLPPNLAADGRLKIERVDSNNTIIGQVHAGAVTDGVRISGSLRKRFFARGRIPGHLHIELIASDGSVLYSSVTHYHRRTAKSGRAYFTHTIAVIPDTVHTIRLVHHGLGSRDS